jgi:hypothetical protein
VLVITSTERGDSTVFHHRWTVPQQFVRVKTADEILEAVAACCTRINDAAHYVDGPSYQGRRKARQVRVSDVSEGRR